MLYVTGYITLIEAPNNRDDGIGDSMQAYILLKSGSDSHHPNHIHAGRRSNAEEARDRRLGVGAKALTTYTACNANSLTGTKARMMAGSGQ